MGRPRVAQIISSGGLYGAERVLLELAKFLSLRGWESHVLVMDSPGAGALIKEALDHNLRSKIFAGSTRTMSRELRRYMQDQRIDLIHSHGYRSDITIALSGLGNRTAKVATCHNWCQESWKMKMYEFLNKMALRRFDRIVAVSPEVQQQIVQAGVPRSTVSVIHNGIDFEGVTGERATARLEFGIQPEEKLLLRVGRLAVIKGNDVLLRTLTTLPRNCKLLFVGDGEDGDRLQRLCRELNLDGRVIFAGFRSDVSRLLAAADVFVISSLNEGLPMVLLEAMASQRPIISTDVGAIPEVITHKKSGLLVPPADAPALASAIAEVLSSPERAQKLAAEAYSYYQLHHSRAAMGERYLELYQTLLDRTASPS